MHFSAQTQSFVSPFVFQESVPPVLAFNLGSLGFLTPIRFETYKETVDRVLAAGREEHTCINWQSDGIDPWCIHLRAYLAALPTDPPECSHSVWSRNGREGCSGMLVVWCHYTNDSLSFCKSEIEQYTGNLTNGRKISLRKSEELASFSGKGVSFWIRVRVSDWVGVFSQVRFRVGL